MKSRVLRFLDPTASFPSTRVTCEPLQPLTEAIALRIAGCIGSFALVCCFAYAGVEA